MPIHTITSIDALNIQPEFLDATSSFPLKFTSEYAKKMDLKNPDDPLLKQVLPTVQERQNSTENASKDPLKESLFRKEAGIIKKYKGRALLIVTGHCDLHCRYCFRRHYPYEQHHLTTQNLRDAVRFITTHPDIEELILSGGDPLSLSNQRIQKILTAFIPLTQLKRLRIHTRTPIANSHRLDAGLQHLMNETPWKTALVLHINHPNEIDQSLKNQLLPFVGSGITLLNQSVLLKGVNDHIDILKALSEALYDAHILPYYLHVLDDVEGSAHFQVPIKNAIELHTQLKHCLSGYLVPKLVQDVPRALSKIWV